MKRQFMKFLMSFILILSLIAGSPIKLVNAKSIDRPILSEDSASLFVGFLMNKGNLSEKDLKNSEIYQIMTNQYNGDDEDEKIATLNVFIRTVTEEMATQSSNGKQRLINDLVTYLETKVPSSGGTLDHQIVNEYQNAVLKKVTGYLKDMIDSVFQRPCDKFFNVSDIFSAYKSIDGAAGKAKEFVDNVVAAFKGYALVMECEMSGRYSYFNSYLSNRPSYKSPEDEIFKTIMSYNRLAAEENNWLSTLLDQFTWITNKDSFTNHFDLIDSWAEFSYQLQLYSETVEPMTIIPLNTIITIDDMQFKVTSYDKVSLCKFDSISTHCDIASHIRYENKEFEVTSLDNQVFENCTNLTEITIPNSITSISDSAFCNCPNLTNINVLDDNPYYSSKDGVLFNKDQTELIRIPSGIKTYDIPSTVTSIATNAIDTSTTLNVYPGSYAEEYVDKNGWDYKIIKHITSISLDKTNILLNKDSSITLNASINPSDTTDSKTLTWTSSNSSVATVDQNGKVTAINTGTTTITVTTSNGKTATCTVTVVNPTVSITSVSLDKTSLTLNKNATTTLKATINPNNAINKVLTWTTSNSSVAIVDSNGKITAKGAGTATITVTTSNGKTATCTVTVVNPTVSISSVSLDKTSLTLNKNATATLKATINPSDTTDSKALTWTSSDSKVATVNNGVVKGIGAGTATITVKTLNGKTATCKVTVQEVKTPTKSKASIAKTKITVKNATYTGKAIKQKVTIKYGKTVLKNGVDYTLSYKNNKNTGKATITIKGKGNYTGSKTINFYIVPKKVTISSVKPGKKQLTVKYKKVTGASGYQIAYSTSKSKGFKYITVNSKTASKVIKKLKSKKTYYVKVRAYKTVGKKKYYGAYSAIRSTKVK